jgi:hypothetical protein
MNLLLLALLLVTIAVVVKQESAIQACAQTCQAVPTCVQRRAEHDAALDAKSPSVQPGKKEM